LDKFHELDALLKEGGALSRHLRGFHARPQQLEMAKHIAAAIAEKRCLITEAGTGTGKTFAYLVPALLSGEKVLISTGTKTLQDQLFERDLPLVRDALTLPISVAQLKGRSNYLCLHRLEQAKQEGLFPSRQDIHYIKKIASFAKQTATGDRSTFDGVPENALIWSLVTSTRDNCLGSHCAFHEECFLMKARKAALEADVVVVNHHLFFADALLREEGINELLPSSQTIIFDEAHQLPDTATMFFGEHVSSATLADFVRDAEVAARTKAPDVPELPDRLSEVKTAAARLRLALGDTQGKFAAKNIQTREDFNEAFDALIAALNAAVKGFKDVAEKDEELALQAENADEFRQMLTRWRGKPSDEAVAADDNPSIFWAEITNFGWQLHTSPLSVAKLFRKFVDDSDCAWILTSATLAVGDDFSHFQREMGLEHAETVRWGSPFDFKNVAQLYVPKNLPLPNSSDHTDAVIDAALPLVEALDGRTFFLFTSHRALRYAAEQLERIFKERGYPWLLLVQGSASRPELLQRFREAGNAVLLGAASFWEGVDVVGDALSLVVIDKLPFAPPDDPLLAARLEVLEKNGGKPFFDWQIPQAAISLKQGAGRLIRSENDRGTLMICDTRLVEKGYGKRLWQSLPPMRRTREQEKAMEFIRRIVLAKEKFG
jgi:ATP-dependent DNA helicase DinG